MKEQDVDHILHILQVNPCFRTIADYDHHCTRFLISKIGNLLFLNAYPVRFAHGSFGNVICVS